MDLILIIPLVHLALKPHKKLQIVNPTVTQSRNLPCLQNNQPICYQITIQIAMPTSIIILIIIPI